MPAAELLMVGYGARQHIRKNALQHLQQEITITRKQGSFTLEESLAQLVFQNDLTREDAMVRALHPEDLDDILEHQSELLDIGRDDLLALFNEMERRARLRAARPKKAAE